MLLYLPTATAAWRRTDLMHCSAPMSWKLEENVPISNFHPLLLFYIFCVWVCGWVGVCGHALIISLARKPPQFRGWKGMKTGPFFVHMMNLNHTFRSKTDRKKSTEISPDFHFSALHSSHAQHYNHTPSPTPFPLTSPAACIGVCVGVIAGRHCRNLAAAAVWRATPRWAPFSVQRTVRLGSFSQP